MNFTIDRKYLVDTLADLVRINSVNPSLVPGAPGEREIAAYIDATLHQLGITAQVHEVAPERMNVVGALKGTGGGRSVMLYAHMDTVGVAGMTDPFAAEIRDGRLYGRGAQDMKGGIAAMLAALEAMVKTDTRLSGDLVFAFVADEEYGSIGTEHLTRHVQADAAIVTEPTDLEICLAHKGFCVFEFETRGRAAHGARPEEGVDANMHMGRIVAELSELSESLLRQNAHPLVGLPSLHIPLLQGGTQLFVYADKCKMSVERRTLPGESATEIGREMESIVRKLADADPAFRGGVRTVLTREPYEISRDADIVKAVAAAVSDVLNRQPGFIGHSWWEDSALIAESGTETVIIGPKGAGIHSHEEWVDIDSVIDLAKILLHAVTRYAA